MEAVTRPEEVTFRPLESRDIDAVVAIEAEAFTTPWRPDTFEGLIGRDSVELVVMTDRDDVVLGYAVLWCIVEQGELAAYFADRTILARLLRESAKPDSLVLSNRYFTNEPHALALARGDSAFRLLVDRTLSHLYRSGDIQRIFARAFGESAQPSDALLMLYLVNTLPI